MITNKKIVSDFFHTVYLNNTDSSPNPSITFWDLSLEQKEINEFSKYCLANAPAPLAWRMEKNDIIQANDLINALKIYHKELNYEMYSFIIDANFQYETELVGFGIANQLGSMFSILPIVEISGRDADSINNAILLVT